MQNSQGQAPTFQFIVPSTSGTGEYVVRRAKDGSHWYCSCPAWKFQKKPARERTCKHLKKIAQEFAESAFVTI